MIRINYAMKNTRETQCNDFRNNFIIYIKQRNWTPIFQIFNIALFFINQSGGCTLPRVAELAVNKTSLGNTIEEALRDPKNDKKFNGKTMMAQILAEI